MKNFDNSNENLIEIRRNIFVAKNDPEFLKKYVQYNPTDSHKLFEYAKELESNGDTVGAYDYFTKAAQYGHYESSRIIEKTAKAKMILPIPPPPAPETHSSNKSNSLFTPLWITLILLSLLLFSFLLFYLFSDRFTINKTNETNIFENNTTNIAIPNDSPTKSEELVFVALHSAIENYQDHNGVYPITETKLLGESPDNYLSFIPTAVAYKKTVSGYSLSVDGINGSSTTANGLFSLIFYEKTNELGVKKGDELLALYPVASSDTISLPANSFVTKRVVNPNGGDGALGTRGFQLTDNFAIHGTNDPRSVGGKDTAGCLRMTNEAIETLYPYIPLGTSFSVNSETEPPEPSLPNGFPPFPGIASQGDLLGESTPDVTYAWKN